MANKAKATPEVINDFSIFTAFSDIRDVVCIGTRSAKNQALKVERIVDLSTDAVLHSVEYLDHTTRSNLAQVRAEQPL